MNIIERLESAQEQTWWLPASSVIHRGPDHCFYFNAGRFSIVRFTPTPGDIIPRLNEICEHIGDHPALFTYFPHRHDDAVSDALRSRGFTYEARYEARAVHGQR